MVNTELLSASPEHSNPDGQARLQPRALELIQNAKQEGDCWVCSLTPSQVYANVKGYGKAHRMVYEAFKGPIPENQFVCHTCDNPRCINFNHLFLGTPNDNMQDKVSKGRQHFGGPGKYLSESRITEARELYERHGWTYEQIGVEFQVNRRTIARALKGAD